jgi:hypothetical protein
MKIYRHAICHSIQQLTKQEEMHDLRQINGKLMKEK